ncbi:MAG: antitoxin [Chloroflexi bacterium]|nr:antitoxin [Chloroflexota bacterium]
MAAETLTLALPASPGREVGSATQDFLAELIERGLREVRVERALDRYARGGISFGAAAQQASVTQSELSRYAYARGMEPPFSAETLVEEVG